MSEAADIVACASERVCISFVRLWKYSMRGENMYASLMCMRGENMYASLSIRGENMYVSLIELETVCISFVRLWKHSMRGENIVVCMLH